MLLGKGVCRQRRFLYIWFILSCRNVPEVQIYSFTQEGSVIKSVSSLTYKNQNNNSCLNVPTYAKLSQTLPLTSLFIQSLLVSGSFIPGIFIEGHQVKHFAHTAANTVAVLLLQFRSGKVGGYMGRNPIRNK